MSLVAAAATLSRAVDDLWYAVCELVVTVHEDRPVGSDLAVVDDLVERVSELQGLADDARRTASAHGQLARALDQVGVVLARADVYYWRELRSHAPVSHLRSAARSRGPEWQAWRRSVEDAVARCEGPLETALSAVREGWHEVSELVALGIGPYAVAAGPGPDLPTHSPTPDPHTRDQSRRSS